MRAQLEKSERREAEVTKELSDVRGKLAGTEQVLAKHDQTVEELKKKAEHARLQQVCDVLMTHVVII